MPYPMRALSHIANEYTYMNKKYLHAEPFYYGMEGFIAAKIFTEALRRAGAEPTREKFIEALESMNSYDVGGCQISYSPTNHSGSKFTEFVVIGKDGRVI